ncbi:unnamed protein product [Rotaria sp. Silwood2]|nr:unnamed protein product [Rotaria sp. Silwood2]
MVRMYCQLVKCTKCNNISPSFQAFNIISLSLPRKSKINLHDAFDEEFKVEKMTDDCSYKCEKCNDNVTAIKNVFIWSLPDLLTNGLKRCHNTHIKFPISVQCSLDDLDINIYCLETRKSNKKHDLYAFIEHYGGMGGGHYVAYCKNSITKNGSNMMIAMQHIFPIFRKLLTIQVLMFYFIKKIDVVPDFVEMKIDDNDEDYFADINASARNI